MRPEELVEEIKRFDPNAFSRAAADAALFFEEHQAEIDAGPKSDRRVDVVRQALIDLILRSDSCPHEAVSALGVLRDRTLLPLFRRCLSSQIAGRDAGGVYAVMMALDELGEDVFRGRASRSLQDWHVNMELAIAYLEVVSD